MQKPSIVTVGAGRHGKTVICLIPIPANQPIFLLDGCHVQSAEKYTIQRSERDHVAPTGADWAMVNHSCNPNCAIDFSTWQLTSLKPISPGEELTFNYLSTEWELASPFDCDCAAPHCPVTIRGYRHLNDRQRDAIRSLVSPFLRGKVSEELVQS
jgi:hypothetical protein